MRERKKASEFFNQALREHGMKFGVMAADPPKMGAIIERYRVLMAEGGLCPMCERKLSNCMCEKLEDSDSR